MATLAALTNTVAFITMVPMFTSVDMITMVAWFLWFTCHLGYHRIVGDPRFPRLIYYPWSPCLAALGGLVVSVLATGPTGHSVADSNPTEGGGFLWAIKIPSTHFLRRGSKAVGPMP
jgi:hypothetical protein